MQEIQKRLDAIYEQLQQLDSLHEHTEQQALKYGYLEEEAFDLEGDMYEESNRQHEGDTYA